MNVKTICIWSFIAACVTGLLFQSADAQVTGTEGVTGVFSTGAQEVAAYDASIKKLRFFSLSAEGVQEIASVPVPGQVAGVVALPESYVVATSMGRGDLSPPIRVHVLARSDLKKKQATLKVVYERVTERPQVNQLRLCGDTVWMGFFESKYTTVVGKLEPPSAVSGGAWSFAQVASLRMGDSFDCIGDDIIVGRSYGDAQGQDGDLLQIRGGAQTLLPSYRGVRGVESVGNVTDPVLVIGDGWHSNYGQVAQGRISLLRKPAGQARFSLEILDRDSANYSFTKFRKVSLGGKQAIIALGSSQIVLFKDIDGSLNKQVLYTQKGSSHVLDMAIGSLHSDGATLVVADEGLHVLKVEQ